MRVLLRFYSQCHKRRRHLYLQILCFTFLILALLLVIYKRILYPPRVFIPWPCTLQRFLPTGSANEAVNQSCIRNTTKLILFYTSWFRSQPWFGSERFLERCPTKRCIISFDAYDIGKSDVAIFHVGHAVDTPSWKEIQQIHNYRCPKQRMALLSQESVLHPDIADISFLPEGFFNWTITFKRTSDFPIPYGRFSPLDSENASPEVENYAQSKDKLIAWAVSYCGTTRERYVKELVKHIKVDVYGKCSRVYGQNNQCPKGSSRCGSLFRTYKFYLSFENAACTDYVTEKFWQALDWKVVPVVLAKDIYGPIAPPGSFISVEDFPTVKALADYLLYLDKNDTAYNEYFLWRKVFISHRQSWFESAVCSICDALHDECLQPKVYRDVNSFWNRTMDCEKRERSLLNLLQGTKNDRWTWVLPFFN